MKLHLTNILGLPVICSALFVPPLGHAQSQPDSQLLGIEQALHAQQYDQAIEIARGALQKTPSDKRLWTLEGMAWSLKASPDEAVKAYNHALSLDARYLPALEGAAQLEYQRKSPAAKGLLQRILALHPQDPTANTMLGYLESTSGDCKAAIPAFAQGGSTLASQPAALGAYGACLAETGEYAQAIPILQQALDTGTPAPTTRYNLALAEWKANEPDKALAALQPLLQDNHQSDAILLAADIHEATGQTQAAIDLLRSAILANPKDVAPYVAFASLSYDHASMQVGIDIINAGLTQLPNEPRLYQVRGILYIQLSKFDEAAADFEKASELDPRLPMLGTAEALSASQQHNDTEAIARFRHAVKVQPKDALTHYLLAEALSLEGPPAGSADEREEIAAAQEACHLDPHMTACHDLLAGLYLQSDQIKLSAAQARAALAIDPNDQQAIYHLILALRKTNDKAQLTPLLKRLAEVRAANHEKETHSGRFALEETPSSAPAPNAPASPR